jgi:UDP-glucose 4-epimerase
MSHLAWVLGASGLLGSALVRALQRDHTVLFQPAARFEWCQPAIVSGQLQAAALAFSERVAHYDRWTVFWSAGVGSMASRPEELIAEQVLLRSLLDALRDNAALKQVRGTIVFASSAGALYGGAHAACYTESSDIFPATAYALHKLEQEQLIHAYIAQEPKVSALILRYSTLYGIGQARNKPQGLITQIARKIVANEPANIFVPLDTIRDYLHVDDAAQLSLATLANAQHFPGRVTLKIVAAERATSIAELIGVFRRISGRIPRIVTSANGLSSRYTRCAQYRSEEPAGKPHRPGRPLLIGIHQVLEAERANKVRQI